jgi:hypothetical protein
MGLMKRFAEQIAEKMGIDDISDSRVIVEVNRRISKELAQEKELEMARELAEERRERDETREAADED